MIDKRIGERIKQCREQLGLTQEQFAERLGLTTNYISTVERGASFPRCEKLIPSSTDLKHLRMRFSAML